MSKKTKKINLVEKEFSPIKVRLIKNNPFNLDKIIYKDIELFTYKFVDVNDFKTFIKLKTIEKYLIVESTK
jgi:hypothetical protein